jgi:hypothetical protein
MTSNWVSNRVKRDHARGSGVDARERRVVLLEDTLTILRHRAEEALAKGRVGRVHLGYEVLLKLKLDELLEREYLPANVSASEGNPDTTVAGS